MTEIDKQKTPSLLGPESRGGDTAERGFTFQDNVILSYIPLWLARCGFTAMIRETLSDAEAKFYVPGKGFEYEFLQMKNHRLASTEFWHEIRRFQELDAGTLKTYNRFTLACTGLAANLNPLVNGLRLLRDPYEFYDSTSPVIEKSYADYVGIVQQLGYTEDEARFLFEKVLIRHDLNLSQNHGGPLFSESLRTNLPEYQDISVRIETDIYNNLVSLVKSRLRQPIYRSELENALREKIDVRLPDHRPVRIHTSIGDDDTETEGLRFEWTSFFGGDHRMYPPAEEWNRQLVGSLQETKEWITEYYPVRRIELTGNRRLSATLAIGSVFSAVAGFALEMAYRGEVWATDNHPTSETPEYPLSREITEGRGEHLVVSIGILRDIASEVRDSLEQQGLESAPRLHIQGDAPMTSPQQANLAVRQVKDLLSDTLSDTGCKRVHLFFAGPSFLALFLGHRLNATASIQCYERVSVRCYVPTCQLFAPSLPGLS